MAKEKTNKPNKESCFDFLSRSEVKLDKIIVDLERFQRKMPKAKPIEIPTNFPAGAKIAQEYPNCSLQHVINDYLAVAQDLKRGFNEVMDLLEPATPFDF